MKKIIFVLLICSVIFEGVCLVIQDLKLKDYSNDVEKKSVRILNDTIYDIVLVQNILDKCASDNYLDYKQLDKIYNIYTNFMDNKQDVLEFYNVGKLIDKKSYYEPTKLINRVSVLIEEIKIGLNDGIIISKDNSFRELRNLNMIFINILMKNNLVYYDKENSIYNIYDNIDYSKNVKSNLFVFSIFNDFINRVNRME